MHSLIFN